MDSLSSLASRLPLTPATVSAALGVLLLSVLLLGGGGLGGGNRSTVGQLLFSAYIRLGRARNLLCSCCDRAAQRYPTANTCQVPFFKSISDVYLFVFGYREAGLFVEVGAYDGESFSNTSGLADLGWAGHYIEPIPQYAAAAAARHAGSAPRVQVHTLCVGEKDGQRVTLSAAGPFSSGVEDEIASVAASNMSSVLGAMGWGHVPGAAKVEAKSKSLNTFFKEQGIQPGQVDVLVIDVEGYEAPIVRSFNLAKWAPKLVIIEIQELQFRYRDNARVQADAAELQAKFAAAGYKVLYKDVVNTVYKHPDTQCCGGS